MATSGQLPKDDWRYIIMISRALYLVIHMGTFKSFGVMIPAIVEQLDCSYSVAGLVTTIHFFVTFFMCPFSQRLAEMLTKRVTTVLGGVLFSFCVCCVFFAKSPLSVGILLFFAGCGNSMIFQTSLAVLQEHFEDEFGSVQALSSIGLGAGGILLPFLTSELLRVYGLHGAFLIMGGVIAHSIPMCMTFRSPRSTSESLVLSWTKGTGKIRKSRTMETCETLKDTNGTSRTTRTMDARGTVKDKTRTKEARRTVKDTSGTQGTYRNVGNITSEKCTLLRFVEKPQCEEDDESKDDNKWRFLKISRKLILKTLGVEPIWKEREFAIIVACQFLLDIVFTGWCLFVVSFALSVGIPPDRAPDFLIIGVIGGISSRFLTFVILKWRPRWAAALYGTYASIMSGVLFLHFICQSYRYLAVCSFIAGFGIFGTDTSFFSSVGTYVAEENFARVLALSCFFSSISMLLSGYVTGRLYDLTQSFRVVFKLYGCIGIIIVVLTLIFIIRRRNKT